MAAPSTESFFASHAVKQLKYILGGSILTWYFGVGREVSGLLRTFSWPCLAALVALLTAALTVALFVYLLVYLPRWKGVQPDYPNWRMSRDLRTVVPLLTGSIVSGWVMLLACLAIWSQLNFIQSLAGSIGSYALMFGLIGLLGTMEHPVLKRERERTA